MLFLWGTQLWTSWGVPAYFHIDGSSKSNQPSFSWKKKTKLQSWRFLETQNACDRRCVRCRAEPSRARLDPMPGSQVNFAGPPFGHIFSNKMGIEPLRSGKQQSGMYAINLGCQASLVQTFNVPHLKTTSARRHKKWWASRGIPKSLLFRLVPTEIPDKTT